MTNVTRRTVVILSMVIVFLIVGLLVFLYYQGMARQERIAEIKRHISRLAGDREGEEVYPLIEAGMEALPYLIEALKNPDDKAHSLAANVIGELGPEAKEAYPMLLEHFKHVHPDGYGGERFCAGNVLINILRVGGDEGAEMILNVLKGPERDMDGRAMHLLSYWYKYSPAIPTIKQFLKDSRPGIRCCAAEALANMGDYEGVPVIISILGGDDKDFRICARGSLAGALGIDLRNKLLEGADVEWDRISTEEARANAEIVRKNWGKARPK